MRSPGLLTGRGRGFLILGALMVLVGMGLGYPDVTRIGVLLALLPLAAMAWSRRSLPSIRVTRTLEPTLLVPDQRGQVDVEFVNTGSRTTPTYLAEEQFDYSLGDRPRFLLPRLGTGHQHRIRYHIRSRHRGAFTLGGVLLRLRDPFGMTHLTLRLPRTAEVLVLPRVFALGASPQRGQGRGTEGEQPQMVALHGEDDVSIRQYRQGDELRRVHWPATAHRGEIMVRQEDRPTRRRVVLLLDSRHTAHPGQGYHASFEWAISAVASVARHLLMDGYVVHLLSDATVRDGSADRQYELSDLLTTLARAQVEPRDTLDSPVAAAHGFTAGGVLVVAAVMAHDEEEIRKLAVIRQPGSSALAFVLDPRSFAAGGSADTPSEEARAAELLLSSSGWQTAIVTRSTGVSEAWEQARASAKVGGRS